MKRIKKFENMNDDSEGMSHLFRDNRRNTEKTLQESMTEFYDEWEDSYIDANTHGVIKKLIEHLQEDSLLVKGKWEIE